MTNNFSIIPYWLTGFIDAEGCFSVNIYPNKNKNFEMSISFIFHISQKESNILEIIKNYLNMGQIVWDSKLKNIKKYQISSIQNGLKLIEFLDQYPLKTSKLLDYENYKQALLFWSNKNNHTKDGLKELEKMTKDMNNNRNLNERHNFLMNRNFDLDPNWIIGFIDGEGCFYCYIQKDNKSPIIQLSLELSQSTHDLLILKKISEELGKLSNSSKSLGRLKISDLTGVSRLIIMNNSELEKLIKIFEIYPLKTKKLLDYKDWKLLWELKKGKAHLTEKGLEQMKKIKEGMNFGRFQNESEIGEDKKSPPN
jgi:hypothetical protein